MHIINFSPKGLGAALLLASLPAISTANFTIRRDSVVPVVFEKPLSMRDNRVGDRFVVRVDGDRDLPYGTRMSGRIVDIRRDSNRENGYMDLEFTDILLPTGRRISVRAFPVPMTDRYVRRDRDGRFTATSNVKKRETMVLGGTAAGLILGSILRKPFEGAVLGAIAGIVLAENERKTNGDVVVAKDQKMGALFEKDVFVETGSYNGQDDWRRDDRYSEGDRYRDPNDRDRYNDDYRLDDTYRDSDIRLRYEDRDLRFDDRNRPFRQGSVVMVPLIATADQLSLKVDEGRTGVYYIEDEENSLRIERASKDYRLNGRLGTLEAGIVERDGVLFVPVELFGKIRGEKLHVNGNRIGTGAF